MPSIRTRVLAIVLIPSAALLVTGSTVSGLLISDAVSARDFSDYLGSAVDPLVKFETVVQQERTLSLRAVGGDKQAQADMQAQRNTTNTTLAQIASLAQVVAKLNPDAVAASNAQFAQLSTQMPVIRQGVDLGQASAADVDSFYTQLGAVVIVGLQGVSKTTPDPHAAAEEITATDLFYVADWQSRATGMAAGAVVRGPMNQADRAVFGQMVGGYRHQLDAQVSRLNPAERARYDALVASNEWRVATAGEDSVVQRGTLQVGIADWLGATAKVTDELRGLWGDHFRYSESLAKDSAGTSLTQAIIAASAVLVVTVTAFLVAVRLANALVRRLRNLRSRTLDLADVKLPSIVQRLHDGEAVDLEAEVGALETGSGDEIGQVAEAFNTAQRTAIEAAVAEAKTRGGISRVFLDIAHRSQVVVHRQLEVLDIAEAKQGDPEHLELLFQLDHLATHARRNAENLLILGGGQPGRKWRRPVALEEIVRSAISETEDFARVSAVRLPEVKVLGSVVADLIHLLAELVDNATSFSPPDSPVSVRGNLVGKGVVVEVEDQGLGIEFEERERYNERLRNPPDFQEMALAGQRQLGLFVIGQLAKRHGIAVSLLDSAYGGVKAIVLIPTKVIEAETVKKSDDEPEEEPKPRRTPAKRPSYVPEPARDPVPRMPVREEKKDPFDPFDQLESLNQWPLEEPVELTPAPRAPEMSDVAGMSLPPAWHSAENASPAGEPPSAATPPRPSPGRKRAPLPRRVRQANLAPQLQVDTPSGQATSPGTSTSRQLRSPEQARSSLASFQRGTRQGRDDASGQHK
ncbi:nitrate- and nitrite sensing domain-containing protein [Amycolatopsis cynarae]|uniref:histidine kinase n=1 Tax=Amycolatopsis cynarae TaxID=2995223 RepID=A0ABY7AZF3_9PSEU|nr:nitrate- and nitrite sensing domain-containing protein [Amycolatopsis sp. HUAS 11-8]WAL64327.1 nitrate- and nitrite sensing domain-containing protein [Amycolatopsis sp. HUAS 11-8]